MLFVALGRGLQKLPPLTLKRPLGLACPAGRDKPNHALS
jgi:hypothetical protein